MPDTRDDDTSGAPRADADQGESIAWTADPDAHLEAAAPRTAPSGPLPVCDYTTDSEEPCEDPATERRWSSAAVVTSAAIGAVVGGLLVAAALVWSLGLLPGSKPLDDGAARRSEGITITPNTDIDEVSEAVAAKAVPSVVNVSVSATAQDPFGRRSEQSGNGSGVIIRKDGYILTNNHVIEGAQKISVTVGVEDLEAKVIGADPSTDLAVIKVEATDLPAIDVGSSGSLVVGEYVMAVGSPFGLEKTVTAGIVSALNRSEVMQGENDITTYTNLIQTDAAINPGNSGGALVDAEGKLVGINTLIQSTSGSSAGIGFAIPADFAMDIAEQLIKSGKATHPYMGVSTETVDENVAEQFGLPVTSGAVVLFVQPDAPAEKAGIERGDIIVRIGDNEVKSVEDVYGAIRQHAVGDVVEVEVVRNDRRETLKLTLGSDVDRP